MNTLPFITDMGETLRPVPEDGSAPLLVPRFWLWRYCPSLGKHQVTNTADSLDGFAADVSSVVVYPLFRPIGPTP